MQTGCLQKSSWLKALRPAKQQHLNRATHCETETRVQNREGGELCEGQKAGAIGGEFSVLTALDWPRI